MKLIYMDQWESQPSLTRRTRRHNSWVWWKLADCEQPRAISIAYVGKLKLYAAHPHILSSLSPEAFQILSHYESYHRVCREARAHDHHFCSPNVMHIPKQVRRRQGKCKVEASVRYAIRESLGRGTSLIIVRWVKEFDTILGRIDCSKINVGVRISSRNKDRSCHYSKASGLEF